MMLRSFLPVGQGAFYCEQFRFVARISEVNVIYDCGSLTDVKLVEEQIRDNFAKDEVIHALFLSHLDEDHINGIPFLLTYCRVKKIFFPLITEQDAKYIRLYNIIAGGVNSFSAAFVNDPYEALDQLAIDYRPELYQINATIQAGNMLDAITITSGTNVADIVFEDVDTSGSPYVDWSYIPYNFRQQQRVKELLKNLNTCLGRDMDNEDLQEIWEKGTDTERKAIKEAYLKTGSLNVNSMTLFSGIPKVAVEQYQIDMLRRTNSLPKAVGCLYTGDYDAAGKLKWQGLYDAYKLYWSSVGCIQIPHHGSRHNYNVEFSRWDAFFIISAGTKNRFRHPHGIVIRDLVLRGYFPLIVTEQKNSEVRLLVNLI